MKVKKQSDMIYTTESTVILKLLRFQFKYLTLHNNLISTKAYLDWKVLLQQGRL